MADLVMDERTLTAVARRVATAADAADVAASLSGGSGGPGGSGGSADDVGSASVATVLDDVTRQLVGRAGLVVEAIQATSDFPTRFASEVAQVEAHLADRVATGDLVGSGSR